MANDAFTTYLTDALLNHVFRTTTFSGPATVWVGLFTAAPSDSGGGTECAGNGYGRGGIPDSATGIAKGNTNWTLEAGGTGGRQVKNSAQINFPQASGTWGTGNITHWALFDAVTAGNMLCWGLLSSSHPQPNSGDIPFIATGELKVQLD